LSNKCGTSHKSFKERENKEGKERTGDRARKQKPTTRDPRKRCGKKVKYSTPLQSQEACR